MPHVIIPFDTAARDLFGVMHMERILQQAEQSRREFLVMRDEIYDLGLPEEARQALRRLAIHLDKMARAERELKRTPSIIH